MTNPNSGIKITDVRVSNFRALKNVDVPLEDLTILIGANNAGKTSFLDALYSAIGAGRKLLGQDDVRLEVREALPPKERVVTVDVCIRPLEEDGSVASHYPAGSFWTDLWGTGIKQDMEGDFDEFVGIRTTLAWSLSKGDYVVERRFLKEWRGFDDWLDAQVDDTSRVNASQIEPLALHYIDAKRDLDDDIRKQGSFWRRMTEDLGLSPSDVEAFEQTLSDLNHELVGRSGILKHLKNHLADIQPVVSVEGGEIDISPVARKLRDLSKGVDISFTAAGSQSFPLARHGMGTRSLASLLVFRAFASWKGKQAAEAGDHVHSLLALEEPEAHLHPQAQRSFFSQVKSIPGQRIVSTHSPYFAGQAGLSDLRLFFRRDGETTVSKLDLSVLNSDDVRKLRHGVVNTRGDLLFARATVFFEGETEEQALPILAEAYWGCSIHELGFSFVRVGGNSNYFAFIWLAEQLDIPWYVFSDGEPETISHVERALQKLEKSKVDACPNVLVIPGGRNFETQLIAEGYLPEIEATFDQVEGEAGFLDDYISRMDGKSGKKKTTRDYKTADGRQKAARDALSENKTRMAEPLAFSLSAIADEARRFPTRIRALFEKISADHGLDKLDCEGRI
ncbi:AAA family ATPase [Acidithiobacillus ferrooxidans]|uniref:ATP-dependent nuclease n=1 Tax=Acidithiobacillus ferrooxidans TaxID=920 RepID=UPI001C070286|nr:AAA family ATPase [Acidithiobacillus ferrooxidans]MBU2860053.1 AAA family ATPase [Acidithiobacillus ferrooxidans]